MNIDYKLNSLDKNTKIANDEGIFYWNVLINFVENLPYGRTKNRANFGLVLLEKKGTCSYKHALLKDIADNNNIPNVKLMIGIYKMNNENTPKIGNILQENNIPYLPEAHCYLNIEGEYFDITTKKHDYSNFKEDILTEFEIESGQVIDFKASYQQEFLKKWLLENNSEHNFEFIWEIREQCIANLSK